MSCVNTRSASVLICGIMLVAAIVAVICLSASLGAADANPAHQQQSAELTHSPDVHLNPDLELRLVHTVRKSNAETFLF